MIDRRSLFLSLALSLCLSIALLVLFAHVGSQPASAEAASRPETPAEQCAPAPIEAAPAGQPAAPAPGDARLRAIADNMVTPSGFVNQRAVRALRAAGTAAVPLLLERFTGEEETGQEAILSVLSHVDDPRATEALLEALGYDPSPRMAAKIGEAIRTRGEDRFCERLAALAGSPSPSVRAGAAIALRTCPPRTGAVVLVRLIKRDDDETVRRHALESLRTGPRDILEQALTFAFEDPSPEVREAAVHMTGMNGFALFQEDLRRLLRSDPTTRVRRAARRALSLLHAQGGIPHSGDAPRDEEPLGGMADTEPPPE